MIGTPTEPGIMVRVMQDLFTYSNSVGKQQRENFKVTVSFLEVYNENIRDLLVAGSKAGEAEEFLDLREDPIKGPVVAGITEVETRSGDEIMSLLHQGNARRSQAATAANEVSSRSHAVLQVIILSSIILIACIHIFIMTSSLHHPSSYILNVIVITIIILL